MNNNNNNNKTRFGLTGCMLVVFTTLKLTGLIDWSWVWITSPFWISASINICLWLTLNLIIKLKKK